MGDILVNVGFDVGSSNPIDSRTVKNTTDERDTLVSEGKVYENLKVYCKDTQTEYRWTGTEWETVDSSSGGGDLTDYQKKTDNTLDTTDKTVTGAINEVNGNLLDTVGFSADYKNIILNRKSGLNPYTIPISAIINNASLTELKDIDSTDVGDGKILVYDGVTNKHKYVDSSITDEFVKMDSTTDAKYLSDLIDKSTVVNDNGILKVKKLDGQEVTITEINYLKGLTMNVMDLVNAFSNGGVKVLNTPLNTASELDTMDRTSFIDGISYIVYVLADETHAGAKTTYLVDKTNTTFFGNADSQRNFTTNPIDLANEVTGKLGTSNIDVDSLWTLLTINDTYKTLTTNNEIFGTHGAKAMYDELTTDIGGKANATDLTTHTGNANIHVTTTDKAKWDKVIDKVTESVSNPAELDTNKFNKNGYYSIGDVRSRTNLPVQQVGTLLVFYAEHYVIQEYILNENQRTFIRRSIDKGANWSAWQELATMDKVTKVYEWTLNKQTYATMDDFLIDMVNRGIIINNANNSVVISFPYFYAAVPEITELNGKGFVNNTIAGGCLYIDGVYSTDTSNQGNRIVARFEGREGNFVYLDNSGWGTKRRTYRQYATNIPNSELTNMNTKLIQLETKQIATQKDLEELFQSVSNGKTLVANAITGKGVSTATDATFATMATNIGKISVSSYKEETKSYTTTSSGITPLTIKFSADVLGVKQVIPPTYSSRITTQSSADVFTINGKELILYVTGEGTWKVTALIKA